MDEKVTKSHFDKYSAMVDHFHIGFDNTPDKAYGKTKSQWLALWHEDKNLNNVPLRFFDAYYYWFARFAKPGFSLAENVCMLKHAIKFRFLGVNPILVDTYQETLS
jgi:hypothetical protein